MHRGAAGLCLGAGERGFRGRISLAERAIRGRIESRHVNAIERADRPVPPVRTEALIPRDQKMGGATSLLKARLDAHSGPDGVIGVDDDLPEKEYRRPSRR